MCSFSKWLKLYMMERTGGEGAAQGRKIEKKIMFLQRCEI